MIATDRARNPVPVETHRRVSPPFAHERECEEERREAERDDEIEDPAPVVRLGEIATEGRRDGGTDDHRHPEQPLRHRPILARVGGEQDRLRQRHDGSAEDPLTHPP